MNEAINKEIFKVCTHKYKKECEKAHENVKKAGYTISKYNGRFIVTNPKTNKSVSIILPKYDFHKPYITCNTENHYVEYKTGEMPKFDFKNYLEKPKNREKYIVEKNKYRDIRCKITRAKYWIKRDKEEVEKAREEINQAIKKLEFKTRELQKSINRLENVREEVQNL